MEITFSCILYFKFSTALRLWRFQTVLQADVKSTARVPTPEPFDNHRGGVQVTRRDGKPSIIMPVSRRVDCLSISYKINILFRSSME